MLLLSELRPNNLYTINKNVIVCLQDHTTEQGEKILYFDGIPEGVNICEVQPIPLTALWFRHLGLVERYVKNEWSWAKLKSGGGEWNYNTEIHCDGGKFYYTADYPTLEYVHQLQNLYASITRQELPYRPELLKPSGKAERIEYLENGLRTISDSAREGADKIHHLINEDSILRDMWGKLNAIYVTANNIIHGKI